MALARTDWAVLASDRRPFGNAACYAWYNVLAAASLGESILIYLFMSA